MVLVQFFTPHPVTLGLVQYSTMDHMEIGAGAPRWLNMRASYYLHSDVPRAILVYLYMVEPAEIATEWPDGSDLASRIHDLWTDEPLWTAWVPVGKKETLDSRSSDNQYRRHVTRNIQGSSLGLGHTTTTTRAEWATTQSPQILIVRII
jgi:hypothetical protein